jgi:hypothetical protein
MNIQVANQSRVTLEIYDLNFKVIYSQRAIGTNSARTDQFGKPKHQTN